MMQQDYPKAEMEITNNMLSAGLDAFRRNVHGDRMLDDITVRQRIRIVSEIFHAMLKVQGEESTSE